MYKTLFEEVVHETENFLGPSARRFVERQISTRLGKHPESLSQSELTELAEWIRILLGHITEKQEIIDKLNQRLI